MSRRVARLLLALGVLALTGGAALGADAVGPEAQREASARFARGLRLFDEGDDAGAAIEFQRAWELTGRAEALLNLGIALAELNRAVEAVDALDRALAAPAGIDPRSLAVGRHRREEQAARIGALVVETNVPARLEVDNRDAGTSPLSAPLRVTAGERLVTAVAPGYQPARRLVAVRGGDAVNVRLDLLPATRALAQLKVRSPLPAAEILVDGQVVGRTPLATSIAVAPGTRTIELRRPGFRTARASLSLEEGSIGEIELDAEEEPPQPDWPRLSFRTSEADADLFIDGRRRTDFHAGLRLAPGLHHLVVHRAGFFPVERDVTAARDRELDVTLTLDPTEETRAAHAARAREQRRRGWVVLMGGAVTSLAGVTLAVAEARALAGARAEYDAVAAMLRPGGQCHGDFDLGACSARVTHANERLDRAESWRWLGPVVGGVGLLAVVTGVVLLGVADDPGKYDVPDHASVHLVPTIAAAPNGALLGLSASF